MLEKVILVMNMEAMFSDDWMVTETLTGDIKIQIYPNGISIVDISKSAQIDLVWKQWDRIVDFVNSRR